MKSLFILAFIVVGASAQCSTSSPSQCTNLKFTGLKNSDKQVVVDEHNRVRRIVAKGQETRGNPGSQPNAANMNKIYWDDNLANVAQRWASKCTFAHDSCRNDDRFYVGQNLYMASSKGSPETDTEDWAAAVGAWYNEVAKFNKNHINPFQFSSDTGHYTQVAWGTTKYVGCGFAAWTASDGWYNKIYVCNYGPGGNIISTKMYEIGNACSQCSNGCDNGLCS